MKKILSRILAVALAVVLFSAPSTAQAATVPICINISDSTKAFFYNPSLEVSQYQEVVLENENHGYFNVPAGNDFSFLLGLGDTEYHSYRLSIYKVNYGLYFDSQIITDRFPRYTIPKSSTDASYVVVLKAYTDLTVDTYQTFIGNQ
ncbi:hypothetical protein [Anaerocolumna xylanovorans]|uniref:Secreted protein n=1 Tax=Anaerocolumna xylanovorans DSM 12503 TaxID=1121345 RepID=A0A1M7Y438_9FIRM|nr:hypothetical protein [Anaerocolumna xylanovorans]SHO46861.1 hypothetical protein SAMN02745217_01315 [Anaerocolumna xylanovorans DSM 12503]